MIPNEEKDRELKRLRQDALLSEFAVNNIPRPWFTAYKCTKTEDTRTTWYSGIVPSANVSNLLKKGSSWDLHIGEGVPSVWTNYKRGKAKADIYCQYGNQDGFEPLVVIRSFHDLRESAMDVSQQFLHYHNLWHDASRKRFLHFDNDGDESVAVRYDAELVEIRTDLLLSFCATKQMAIASYVDSSADGKITLEELGIAEERADKAGPNYCLFSGVVESDFSFNGVVTFGHLMGKRYFIPETVEAPTKSFQEFIIGADQSGKPIKHTCDPDKLANYFGANPNEPHYLTPVYFRIEVMSKYYNDSEKYTVSDGDLSCGSLWNLRIDNDHDDYVVVFLGDLGRDLSDRERDYWISFNIVPDGRKLSDTTFKRGFLAVPCDPARPDLLFKHEYRRFKDEFRQAHGWDFFLPLHPDDEHYLTALRVLSKDSQSEFDSQLLGLTKLIVDSLNEKEIAKGIFLDPADKGITKLEKFFVEKNAPKSESQIKFLRVLQDLRSKSAAHRKGSSYDKIVGDMQLKDEGQQRVFAMLLARAAELIAFLRHTLLRSGGEHVAEGTEKA